MTSHNFGTNYNNVCIHNNMGSCYLLPLWWKLQAFSPSSAFQELKHLSHFEVSQFPRVRIIIPLHTHNAFLVFRPLKALYNTAMND